MPGLSIPVEVATYHFGPAATLLHGSAELGDALVQQVCGRQAVMAHWEIATVLEALERMEPAETDVRYLEDHYTAQEMDAAQGTSPLEEGSADTGVSCREAAYPAKSGH